MFLDTVRNHGKVLRFVISTDSLTVVVFSINIHTKFVINYHYHDVYTIHTLYIVNNNCKIFIFNDTFNCKNALNSFDKI